MWREFKNAHRASTFASLTVSRSRTGEGLKWHGDSRFIDWTYGCIALADTDLDFVGSRSAVGTPVLIEP